MCFSADSMTPEIEVKRENKALISVLRFCVNNDKVKAAKILLEHNANPNIAPNLHGGIWLNPGIIKGIISFTKNILTIITLISTNLIEIKFKIINHVVIITCIDYL